MTIQQKLISIGGTLEENRIILKNIDIPFYIPSEELNEAYYDLMTNKIRKLSFDYKKLLEKHLDKKAEISATGDNEIKKYFDKIA